MVRRVITVFGTTLCKKGVNDMAAKKKEMKTFMVDFDLVCSHNVSVRARTASEAIEKAMKRFHPRLKKRSFWRITWERYGDGTMEATGGRDGKGW